MANAFTAGGSGASWDLLTETAFDRATKFALRDEPQFRQVIDTRPTAQAMPGDVVTMTISSDLTVLATTPLTETVDPDAVAPVAPTRVNITLNEYGNATLTTLRLEKTAFIAPDPITVEILGRNQYDTMDALVRGVADTSTNTAGINATVIKGTNVVVANVAAGDNFSRNLASTVVSLLRRDKVMPKAGPNYLAVCHGDVLYDLMAENSATAWNAPHTVGGDTGAVYAGEVGEFLGARYIRTTRTTTATDGAAAAKVYRSYFFGREAIAEAVAVEPHTVVGPQIDKLKRHFPLGWYGLLGWSLFRPQALRKVYTTSSISAVL